MTEDKERARPLHDTGSCEGGPNPWIARGFLTRLLTLRSWNAEFRLRRRNSVHSLPIQDQQLQKGRVSPVSSTGRIGFERVALDTPTTRNQEPRVGPERGPLWQSDEMAVAGFWPERRAHETGGQGIPFRPSELHRLQKSFVDDAKSSPVDLDDLDRAIAAAVDRFRAASRNSAEREELARQIDALRARKDALQDELTDVANWSA